MDLFAYCFTEKPHAVHGWPADGHARQIRETGARTRHAPSSFTLLRFHLPHCNMRNLPRPFAFLGHNAARTEKELVQQ